MNRPKRISPKAGQESVWDYPRPPRLEVTHKHLQVLFNGVMIAETHKPIRILETSHPPGYYIPPQDIKLTEYFKVTERHTVCEFKGLASYYTLTVGDKSAENVGWFYPNPTVGYEALKDYVALYPGRMDACYLDGERVQAQSGDFYGGWITADIVGPFKGDPTLDTRFW